MIHYWVGCCLTHIRLGRKGSPGGKHSSLITAVKCLMALGHGDVTQNEDIVTVAPKVLASYPDLT
jgi:hypothetical protein